MYFMADLDIIVPVHNEAESVDELVLRIDSSLSQANINYNLIFVDDYSTDNTGDVVKKHADNGHQQNGKKGVIYDATNGNGHTNGSRVTLIRKKGKQGKAFSILEGALSSNAPYVAMIDGDLQYPPEALPEMYRLAQTHGVVVANRKMNGVSPLRKIGSIANILIFEKMLLGFDCDTQSGLKIFKREIIESLDEKDVTPWTLDMPLLTVAQRLGYGIGSIDIKFTERKNGQSKVDLVKTAAEIAQSAIKLRFNNGKAKKLKPENGDAVIGAGVAYRGRRFITHTHLPQEQSALQTLVPWQKIAIGAISALVFLGLLVSAKLTAIFLIAVLSLIYFIDLVFSFSILLKSLHFPPEIKVSDDEIAKLKEENLPIYSILCPLYKEANVLPQFLKAIDAIDWPENKLDVLLLLEEDDVETIQASNNTTLPSYVRVMIVPDSQPKTKPKACNYGLAHATGKYVVIYDAEDRPDPLQLKKSYIAFNNISTDIVCLQSKLNYYNTNYNLLTRLFTAEYSLWFDLILPGLQSINTAIPLGGTSNHFKTSALRYLYAWDSFNVTEDCDLGVRLYRQGFKTGILDSVTLEEANSKVGSWLKQRSRWIKGYLQTYLVHMRDPIDFYKKHGIHSLIFQLVIGMRMVFMLINPILWLATISYFALNSLVGPAIEALYPAPIFYIAVITLIFGNFIYLYTYMIGAAKRRQWELLKFVFFVPFYWIMASVASVIALYQLVVKPHYWEKTQHGLHLKGSKKTLPTFSIAIDLDLTLGIGFVTKLLSTIFWPIAVVVRNALDFLGLFASLNLNDKAQEGKRNILIFNWRDTKHVWAGGAEVYIQELAKRWVEKGHSVTIFCGWDGKSGRNGQVDGVNVIRRGGFYTVYLFAALYYLFRLRGEFDIVVDSENGVPFFSPLFVGVPKILLIHHVHQEVFRKYLRVPFSNLAGFLESKVMPYFYSNPSVVTVSNSSKDDILARVWTEERNIEIITPGINTEKFSISEKTKYPSFVYLGRLKDYKNIDILIKAFAQIYAQHPNAKLNIAGLGESLYALKRLAKKLKIEHAVEFLGRVSDEERKRLFSESWVAVQPSLIEGWGFTVIEANASGTPVIASNVKGLRDSVIDGETGILFPVGDLAKLTQVMESLKSNGIMREKLSQNAYEWSQRFNWDLAATKFEGVLEKEIVERQIFRGIPEAVKVHVR